LGPGAGSTIVAGLDEPDWVAVGIRRDAHVETARRLSAKVTIATRGRV